MNAETRSKMLKRARSAPLAKAVLWATAILLAAAMAPRTWAQGKTQETAAKVASASVTVNGTAARGTTSPENAAALHAKITGRFAALPMLFEKNEGQVDGRVKFLSRGDGFTLFLTNDEMVMALARPPKSSAPSDPPQSLAGFLTLLFEGAGGDATIAGSGLLPGKTNYLLGSNPAQWHTNVPNYSAAEYQGLYPGVDAIFHGDKQQLEFDFEIAPGAEARDIALDVQGSQNIRLNSRGDIVLQVDGGTQIIMGKPRAYQEVAGERREVASNYVLDEKGRIRFALGAYDASQALVIDPTLTYSTYIAGISLQATPSVVAVAADSTGKAYVAGTTLSSTPTFPVKSPSASGPFQATCPGFCTNPVAFVMKIDPTQTGANSLVYSTYFGPTDSTSSFSGFFTTAAAIAVDSSGDAYLAGNTNSAGLPIPSTGAQPTFHGTAQTPNANGFVAELDPNGSSLLSGTYLGGTKNTVATGIAVDASGVYVTGYTNSVDLLPPSIPPQTLPGVQSGFVGKLLPNLGSFFYLFYLGGSAADAAHAIAVDSTGRAFVVGSTTSTNFPTVNPYQATLRTNTSVTPGNQNAFLTVVQAVPQQVFAVPSLVYSTYLGGTGADVANGVAVGPNNTAYLTGNLGFLSNNSSQFPVTVNTACSTTTCPLMFVAKIDPSQTGTASLVYSSYLGGIPPSAGIESANGIAVDSSGDAFVTGWEQSAKDTGFPLASFQNTPLASGGVQVTDPCAPLPASGNTATDAAECKAGFLVEFSPDAASLPYSTFLGVAATVSGGSANNFPIVQGTGIAADPLGDVLVAGLAGGSAPIVQVSSNGFQQTAPSPFTGSANSNGFLSVFATASSAPPAPPAISMAFGAPSIPLNGATTLSFTVTNPAANTVALNGVAFTDPFPAGLVVATPNGLTGTCGGGTITAAAGSASVNFAGATLAAASSCTFSVNVTGTAAGQLTNTTSAVTSTNGGTGNTASANLAVIAPPTLTLTFGAASVALNGTTTLSFAISNPAPNSTALAGVGFSDTFPAGLIVAMPNGLTGTCGGGVITAAAGSASVSLSDATIPAGSSCTFSVNVTAISSGTQSDTASSTSTNGGTGNSATASLTVAAGLPPATILDNETITVNDVPTMPDVSDTEPIHVADQVFVAPVEAIGAPVASYSTGSLGFGSVPAGQTGTQVLAVSNAGQGQTPLALGAPLFSNSAFALSSVSCSNGAASLPANLASGAECILVISYTAPAGNAATGTITFADNAALSNLTSAAAGSSFTQTVALNGSGTTTPPPALPPAVVSIPLINETISVQDSATFPDIADMEAVSVKDQVTVLTLQSIAVTPANSIVAVGLTKVFSATGTYSDGSTQDLTAAVAWSSSDPAVASMSSNTATGLARGNTTIAATLGSTSGSTNLRVTFPFIRIAAKFASITLNSAGNYDVVVSFTNTGDIVATSVQPQLTLLGRALLPVTSALADLAPGATAMLHLVFPASAGSPGSQVAFIAIGTATGTNPNGSPNGAIWITTPIPTVVTLP